MSDDSLTLELATDAHGLVDCGCGANQLYWSTRKDYLAHEADHTLEEARKIDERVLPWNRKSPDDDGLQRLFDQDLGPPNSWEEWVERERDRAERNGLAANCAECYGSMSPTMATHELADRAER